MSIAYGVLFGVFIMELGCMALMMHHASYIKHLSCQIGKACE